MLDSIDKWDRYIIISNLPFSKKCKECAENSNIFLILESEIENLMEYIKFQAHIELLGVRVENNNLTAI